MKRHEKKTAPPDDSKPPGAPTARRSFLNLIWGGLGVIALLELAAVVAAYLKPERSRRVGNPAGNLVVAGPVDRFSPGTVTAFVRDKFYLARLEDGGVMAMCRQCTHLGCTLPWDDSARRFACPCHGSVFDIRGEVVSPPAPRALDYHPVHIENGIVKVDTGRRRRRQQFSRDQAAYPAGPVDKG